MNIREALRVMAGHRLHENQWDAVRQKIQAILPDLLRYDRYNEFAALAVGMNDAAKAESPQALHAAVKQLNSRINEYSSVPKDIQQVLDELEAFGARSILSRRQADPSAGGVKQVGFDILGLYGSVGDDGVSGTVIDRKEILSGLDDYYRRSDLVKAMKQLVDQGYLKADDVDARGRTKSYVITPKGVRWHRSRTSRMMTQRMRAAGSDTPDVQAAQDARAAKFAQGDRDSPIYDPGSVSI